MDKPLRIRDIYPHPDDCKKEWDGNFDLWIRELEELQMETESRSRRFYYPPFEENFS